MSNAQSRPILHQAAPFLISGAGAFAVASLGGSATDLGPWYDGLRKPAWQPPGWAFPVAWTLIFTFCAIAAGLMWNAARTERHRKAVVAAFLVNAILNVAWSVIFFTLQRPLWALYEVGLLWASIAALLWLAIGLSRLATGLLLPYIVWVSIAAVLNYEIVRLNPV